MFDFVASWLLELGFWRLLRGWYNIRFSRVWGRVLVCWLLICGVGCSCFWFSFCILLGVYVLGLGFSC